MIEHFYQYIYEMTESKPKTKLSLISLNEISNDFGLKF